MKKIEPVRVYKFSDGKLITLVEEKIANAQRDSTEFEQYGITYDTINLLQTDMITFRDLPTDVEVLGKQVIVTEAKDIAAEALRVAIRELMSRVEIKYKVGSARYNQYGTEELSRQTDANLLVVGRRVQRLSVENIDDLASCGVNDDLINNLKNHIAVLDKNLIEAGIKKGDRDIEQEDRVLLGNKIYEQLVKITNTGQRIWETKNIARYNDYIIYNTHNGEAEGLIEN